MMLEILVLAAAAQFIVLQTLDGRDVHINAQHIVSLTRTKDPANSVVTSNASCIVLTLDRAFITVAENCESIRKRLDILRGGN